MDYLVLLLLLLSSSSGQVPPSWFPSTAECDAICREGEDGEISKNFGAVICYTKYCLVTNRHYEKSTVPENRKDQIESHSPLLVQTKIIINTVSDIVMSEQLVSANMKIVLAWEDPGLGACRCHYQEGEDEIGVGGGEEFTLGADVEDIIWEPDLTAWNYRKFEREAGMGRKKHAYLSFSRVSKGGLMVELEVHVYTTVSCNFDVSKFPFDVNPCYIRLGSYLHGRDEIIFNTTEVSVQDGEKLRAGEFAIELHHLPEQKSFDEYEDEIKSLFGFMIKIKRNSDRVKGQYTKMMGSIIFLTLTGFFLDVMDNDDENPNFVDRGGLLGGGILCTVLVFQYTVRYTPTMEELIMNPVVLYNVGCLVVCVVCIIQWCLLSSSRFVGSLCFCGRRVMKVFGKRGSEPTNQTTTAGESTPEEESTSEVESISEREAISVEESISEEEPISEEELKRARLICDAGCFVFILIGFFTFSAIIFNVDQ